MTSLIFSGVTSFHWRCQIRKPANMAFKILYIAYAQTVRGVCTAVQSWQCVKILKCRLNVIQSVGGWLGFFFFQQSLWLLLSVNHDRMNSLVYWMVWQSKASVNLHAELPKPMLTIDGEAGSRSAEDKMRKCFRRCCLVSTSPCSSITAHHSTLSPSSVTLYQCSVLFCTTLITDCFGHLAAAERP